MKTAKPHKYVSEVTGREYDWNEYRNWGLGVEKRGHKDLPKDEYPYRVIYK